MILADHIKQQPTITFTLNTFTFTLESRTMTVKSMTINHQSMTITLAPEGARVRCGL